MSLLYEKLYLNLLGTRDAPTSHACNLLTAERSLHRSQREPTFIEFMKNFKPRWDDLKREFGS
jgi:hypothetical protein